MGRSWRLWCRFLNNNSFCRYALVIIVSVTVSTLYLLHNNKLALVEGAQIRQRYSAKGSDVVAQNKSYSHYSKLKKNHFVYIKVAKTGSTTFANIFSAYAYRNRLNMMMSTTIHKSFDTREMKRGKTWNVGPREDQLPDMAFQHARYSYEFHTKHFPKDTAYIASVRDIPKWFISYVDYMQLFRDHNPKEVLQHKNLFFLERKGEKNSMKKVLHNNFLQWLGFDEERSNNLQAIQDYINFIDKQFYLVMITEYFDESLVLLRRMMNWSMADIFYKYANEGGTKSGTVLTEEEKVRLVDAEHNLGDWLLYQHFNLTFWQKIAEQEEFFEEVELFRKLQKVAHDYCHSEELKLDKSLQLNLESPWEGEISLMDEHCLALTIVPGHHKPLTHALDKYVTFRYNFTGVGFRTWEKKPN